MNPSPTLGSNARSALVVCRVAREPGRVAFPSGKTTEQLVVRKVCSVWLLRVTERLQGLSGCGGDWGGRPDGHGVEPFLPLLK